MYVLWPDRPVPMPDRQPDNSTFAARLSLARRPSAPHLGRGDPDGEEATQQPGGPAAHSIVRAGGRRVHQIEQEEEEETRNVAL
jgi:hypothetical protein